MPPAGTFDGWFCDCPDSGVGEAAAGGAVVCWEPAVAWGALAVWAHACWASHTLITNKVLTIFVALCIFTGNVGNIYTSQNLFRLSRRQSGASVVFDHPSSDRLRQQQPGVSFS